MTPLGRSAELRELQRWLDETAADAGKRVAELLDLPLRRIRSELRDRSELRTVGVIQRLIAAARGMVRRNPRRAHELTSVAVEYAAQVVTPHDGHCVVLTLRAEAWKEHANALRAVDETTAAQEAIAIARALYGRLPASGWHLAIVGLIEAEILHDLGRVPQSLELVRTAASQFALHRDHDRYVDAQMTEAWLLWSAGETAAAAEVWRTSLETARQRGDEELTARLADRLGLFELRFGRPDHARELLFSALAVFDRCGSQRDATRTRWYFAEAAAACGRWNEAISEYHKVRAELLATADAVEAAFPCIEIVALLLDSHRSAEVTSLLAAFIEDFRETGMPANALDAFVHLHECHAAGNCTDEEIAAVRVYFEELPDHPNAPFIPPH